MGTITERNYFRVGDRVRYTGTYYMLSPYLKGEEGVVKFVYLDVDDLQATSSLSTRQCATVVFDNPIYNNGTCRVCLRRGENPDCVFPAHGGVSVYSDNLELAPLSPTWEL